MKYDWTIMFRAEKEKLRAQIMTGAWKNLMDTFGRHKNYRRRKT